MLSEAVRCLKAGIEPDLLSPLNVTTDINLHAPALLPDDYCDDVHFCLSLYKKLATAKTPDQIDSLMEEIIDRFGKLPLQAQLGATGAGQGCCCSVTVEPQPCASKLSSLSSSLQTLHEQEAPSDAQLLALLHTTTLAADIDLKIARELPAFSDAPNSRYHCTKHFFTQVNPFLMKATHFTDHIRDHMAINFTRSNVLEVQGGLLTGHRVHQPWGDICDGAEKRSMLLQLCDPLRINPKQTIAMGDGANDLPMMGVAGLDRLLTLFQS